MDVSIRSAAANEDAIVKLSTFVYYDLPNAEEVEVMSASEHARLAGQRPEDLVI